LLYRALLSARLHPEARVLVLTHNKPLRHELERRTRRLADLPENLACTTFFQWAAKCLGSWEEKMWWPSDIERAVSRLKESFPALGKLSTVFLTDEIGWIKDHRLLKRELYLEAERLFSRGGDVEAILAAYQRVLDQYPDSPYAPKARYAIGWIHEYISLERDGAEQAYRILLDTYGNTDYGKEAKLKLGLAQKTEAEKTPTRKQEQQTTEEQQPSTAELTLEAILDELQGENFLSVNEPEVGRTGN